MKKVFLGGTCNGSALREVAKFLNNTNKEGK